MFFSVCSVRARTTTQVLNYREYITEIGERQEMMHYTDNPARDAENYYEDGMKEMRERPKCEYCGHYIADEVCYEIDGNIICDDCILDYLHENCRVKTEEVI